MTYSDKLTKIKMEAEREIRKLVMNLTEGIILETKTMQELQQISAILRGEFN